MNHHGQARLFIFYFIFNLYILFYIFPIVSLWELMTPGGAILTPGAWLAGFINNYYTLLHTKYESSGPCGFRKDVFMFFP